MNSNNPAIRGVIQQLRQASNAQETTLVARSIINKPKINVIDLVVAFEKLFVDIEDVYPLELKLNTLETMAKILLLDTNKIYLKHFVTRISFFFDKYSVNVSKNPQLSSRIMTIFQEWKKAQLFAPTFLKKLENLANPIFVNNTVKPQIFKKYNQNFLTVLKDVQDVEFTKRIYQMEQLKDITFEEVNKIREEASCFQRIGESYEERRERLSTVKKNVEGVIDSLSRVLQMNGQNMEQLRNVLLGEELRLERSLK